MRELKSYSPRPKNSRNLHISFRETKKSSRLNRRKAAEDLRGTDDEFYSTLIYPQETPHPPFQTHELITKIDHKISIDFPKLEIFCDSKALELDISNDKWPKPKLLKGLLTLPCLFQHMVLELGKRLKTN